MSGAPDSRATAAAAHGTFQGTGHLYVMSVVWIVVAGIVVAARVFTRVCIVRNPAADDALIVVALMASLGMSITMIEQINAGMNTATPDTIKVQKAFWASVWTYNLSLCFTKLSILFSYFRIFVQVQLRRACTVLLVLVIIFAAWTVLGSIFVCVPVSKAWTTMDLYGSDHCLNRYVAWFTNAAIHMVLDLILIVLPMPILVKLNMPIRQKIALMMVFALGIFVCAMSIIRLDFLVSMSHSNDNKNTAVWSIIETNVGIICASLPSLKALIVWVWPRFSGYSQRSRNQSKTPKYATDGKFDAGNTYAQSVALKSMTRHSTRVEGPQPSSKRFWNDKDRFNINHQDSMTNLRQSESPPTVSRNNEPGIAVTTILEQEIETMEDDRCSGSISEGSSTKDLFRNDSGMSYNHGQQAV